MTRDDIIRMAREADPLTEDGWLCRIAALTPETLERFAALVRAAPAPVAQELPEPTLEDHEYELWGQNVRADFYTSQQMRAYGAACAPVPAPVALTPAQQHADALLEALYYAESSLSDYAADAPYGSCDAQALDMLRGLIANIEATGQEGGAA
jgi:hypothetical protein